MAKISCQEICNDRFKSTSIIASIAAVIVGAILVPIGLSYIFHPTAVLKNAPTIPDTEVDYADVRVIAYDALSGVVYKYGIVLLIIGLLFILASVLAILAVLQMKMVYLNAYILLVIIADVGLIVQFIVIFINYEIYSDIDDYVRSALEKKWTSDVLVTEDLMIDMGSLDDFSAAWAKVQFEFGCCGVTGFSDYSSLSWRRCGSNCRDTSVVPLSCCSTWTILTFHPPVRIVKSVPSNTLFFENVTECMMPNPHPGALNNIGCSGDVYLAAIYMMYYFLLVSLGPLFIGSLGDIGVYLIWSRRAELSEATGE